MNKNITFLFDKPSYSRYLVVSAMNECIFDFPPPFYYYPSVRVVYLLSKGISSSLLHSYVTSQLTESSSNDMAGFHHFPSVCLSLSYFLPPSIFTLPYIAFFVFSWGYGAEQ